MASKFQINDTVQLIAPHSGPGVIIDIMKDSRSGKNRYTVQLDSRVSNSLAMVDNEIVVIGREIRLVKKGTEPAMRIGEQCKKFLIQNQHISVSKLSQLTKISAARIRNFLKSNVHDWENSAYKGLGNPGVVK